MYSVISLGVVLAVTVFLVCLRHRKRFLVRKPRKKEEETNDEEAIEFLPGENKKDGGDNVVISTLSLTDELAICRGEVLLKVIEDDKKVEEKAALSEDNIKRTGEYLEAFGGLRSFFVETNFSKQCKNFLQMEGVAILTGPPGSGKTLAAVHIINDPFYNEWDKRKISSWREFSFIDPQKKTLVLIDNIFDGHMYRHGLDKWWDTLIYMYMKYIENPKSQNHRTTVRNVHLLITAKDSAFEKASQIMDRNIPVLKRGSMISTSMFPLSEVEKNKILDAQLDYAHEKKGIKHPVMDEQFRKEILKTDNPVGFPLCAHLYACEQNYGKRDLDVFRYPESYQRSLIRHEIINDKTNSVKTLLVFLLLYDADTVIKGELPKPNLNDPEHCSQLLQEAYSKEMVDKLQPLDFSNLLDISKELSDTILVRHVDNLCDFIHQTFRNAVGFHFCTEHFETAVEHFPLDVLEKQSFHQFPEDHNEKLIIRFMKEIRKGNISKVFACPVFKQQCFSKQFCEMISNEITRFLLFTDTESTFNIPLIFWVSKYCLISLSRYLFEEIEKYNINKEFNFLLARFGDCCANDDSFLRKCATVAASATLENMWTTLFGYSNAEKHSIWHLILLSEKPDVECYSIMQYLLQQSATGRFCNSGESILNVAIKHQNCSRILCILAALDECKNVKIRPQITELAQMLSGCNHNVYLELEMVTRLCILFLYFPDSSGEGEALNICTSFQLIQELLDLPQRTEDKMLKIMEEACKNLLTGPDEGDVRIPNPRGEMSTNFFRSNWKYCSTPWQT